MKLSDRLKKLLEKQFSCEIVEIRSNGRRSNNAIFQGYFSWYARPSRGKIIGSMHTMKECVDNFVLWELVTNSSPYDSEIVFTPSNNRLHMDAGDSPRLPSQSTLEGFTPAEQGTTPAPRQ